ncbi:class II glutamine amidotransferase [Pontibaca methylaminivorans]|uniref:glutamine--fructose-6-phosphate transaminase (isomerizing) n=1 Tax=Pontibaca methylaminivorans TaxID=515897 RepID=A0A1R3WW44_9RHOB|nr:glutamine amidotransferase family protein [Pontibaca methylaminivorans]SIT82293.1 N-methylglutamate synthase subunit A [Pontibaca methylaminivorans]
MCGIVGLFLKDKSLEPRLGELLTEMLITMTERGPDSAGLAIYRSGQSDTAKVTVQSPNAEADFANLDTDLGKEIGAEVKMERNYTHALLTLPTAKLDEAREALARIRPDATVMGTGESMEIYKEVGLPKDVAESFHISQMSGSHGIGHTRMATESNVTTNGAHPYSTGTDQCLVHNGSLSNHNMWRRRLAREGIQTVSQNDTEVGAAYISWKLQNGASLKEALESSVEDIDGFFNFVVGTKDGFGVVRDHIATKPAIMAETDQYVAFASEYRAFADLPGIENAKIWEPEPATAYFWSH